MRKKECIAMLLAGGQGSRLGNLTNHIAKPAVAFGGKYRIIDFALSNCSNSGLDTIGVLVQYKPFVLNSYIGSGDSWALDSIEGGIHLLPPYESRNGGRWYKGTADAVYQNFEFINSYNPEHVLIISGDQIYNMDYSKMFRYHKEKNSDVTISVIEVPWKEANRFGVMDTDNNGKIREFQEKPDEPKSNKASMGIYIFKWKCLKRALMEDHFNEKSSKDFGKDIIPTLLKKNKRLFAYPYKGYWRDVGTIESYYETNMDLLDNFRLLKNVQSNLKHSNNTILHPQFISKDANINNSLICDGCKIYGSVSDSVLGTNVYIGKNTLIKNSIILEGAVIGDNCVIDKSIVCEYTHIKNNKRIRPVNDNIEIVYNEQFEYEKDIV